MLTVSVRSLPALAAAGLVFAAAACGSNEPPQRIEPGVEQRAVAGTTPTSDRLLVFEWSLREGQSRFSGAGAARVESNRRARLDLFGPQDVAYLSAVVIGDDIRLSAGVPERVVPPPALLWSALGVIRPPAGVRLQTAIEAEDGVVTLVYTGEQGRWTYRIAAGALRSAEWVQGGNRYTVELDGISAGAPPARALYRDWQEYRELVLEQQEQRTVASFPPDTWILEAR